jgi:hypothetical protein
MRNCNKHFVSHSDSVLFTGYFHFNGICCNISEENKWLEEILVTHFILLRVSSEHTIIAVIERALYVVKQICKVNLCIYAIHIKINFYMKYFDFLIFS